MRVLLSILLVLTLLGAYSLGRWASGPALACADSDLSTLASFRGSLAQGDALERSYCFFGFLQTLSPDNVEPSSEILETWHPWLLEDELRSFMIAWTSFDAPGALEWGLSRSGVFRDEAAPAALEGWAFHDPEAARRALASLSSEVAPELLEEYFVAGWLRGGHHAGVVAYIESYPAGAARQRYTNLLTIEFMREGPEAVIDWVEAIPDDAAGAYKKMAFQKAGYILAQVDPVHAARWLEPHLEHGYSSSTPRVIARSWFAVDPPAALAWLASLPRGDQNEKLLRATLLGWLRKAPEEAEAWVRSSSPAEGLDVAVHLMIERNQDAPQTALDWAERIHDPAGRYRTVLLLARAWHRRDPEAVQQWLAQSELPEGMERAILSPRSLRRGEGARTHDEPEGAIDPVDGAARRPAPPVAEDANAAGQTRGQ